MFEAAVQRAIALDSVAFVVLGDLFDTQKPEPQLVTAVQRILRRAHERSVRVLLLVGNHDQVSDAPDDHALGPLAPYADIIDRPTVVRLVAPYTNESPVDVGLVPFRAGAPASEWLPGTVRELLPPVQGMARRILGVHMGVRDSTTAKWLQDASDAIDAEALAAAASEARVGSVLAGNWHDRRGWRFDGVDVLQLGALTPTGWDNPGLDKYGTLAVWEDGVVRVEELPGPRFATTDAGGLLALAAAAQRKGHRLYVQVKSPPGALTQAVATLHEVAGEPTNGAGAPGFAVDTPNLFGEVLVDDADVEEQVRDAAAAAAGASSLSDGLAAYMAEVPLDDGVDRAAVSALVRGYLGLEGGAR